MDKADHAQKSRALSAAHVLKSLENWGFKVADKVERLMRATDAVCTLPLKQGFTHPNPRDLTFDYRAFTSFFTLDAIADIGLSEHLGFLDQGHDRVKAEQMDGTIHEGELVAEIYIMMNAGSDTTAIAMNNVMYWLLENPNCMANLREEVDTVLEPDEIVASYDKVKHLPYLRACLDESLRITPPTTFGRPRRTPPEGWNILGDYIPGDTTVSTSAYITHRDPQVFPKPESYAPERWLGEKGKDL
ncbi:hypothetical protein NW762_005934 [Fusarium torreyae]|uniref:Cytochrome P450 monooxygenase n=1 Tax=Fusarium torreyae TaxID=1237075 RepID=A0A9W8S4H0_9HYPO|nr:hypothetical protein NW762_005934 [Fusarium torreyae]